MIAAGEPPQEWLEINDWLFELQSRHHSAKIEGFHIFSCAPRCGPVAYDPQLVYFFQLKRGLVVIDGAF